jgi:hypothetical protein
MIFTTLDDIPNGRVFSALTGMTKDTFAKVLVPFSAALEKLPQEAYEAGRRKRSPGAGITSKGLLDTPEKKLFFILYYLKTYPTFDVLGYLFDMDGGNANSHVHTLCAVLKRALADLGMSPTRTLNAVKELDDLLDHQGVAIIDGVERECVRPQDDERQKIHYSGKKKDIR